MYFHAYYYYCTCSWPRARFSLAAAMFSMAPIWDSMDTVSCRVDQLSQWGSCAGACLSDSAPGLRSSPPSLAASTRWLSGGVQNNNTAVIGLSVMPRTCQHYLVLLQPLREGGRREEGGGRRRRRREEEGGGGGGALNPQSRSDAVSVDSASTLSSYLLRYQKATSYSFTNT